MLASDHQGMQALIEDLGDNKSAKIRRLKQAGYRQADIARFLGISPQFVSNVVRRAKKYVEAADAHEDGMLSARPDPYMKLQVGPGGRIVIPASVREAMGIDDGATLFCRFERGELTLGTAQTVLGRVQTLVRQHVPEGVSLVDDLLADRRQEAAAEDPRG